MRGVAILFIVFHNLTRMLTECKENEFIFSLDNTNLFYTSLLNFDSSLWLNISTFLGWYGVVIFVFLSGYGLVCKYEDNPTDLQFKSFFWYNFKKLFSLMVIPCLLYMLMAFLLHNHKLGVENAFYQLTFLANLITPDYIDPGIYWYFGLMLQLYICYYFFFYKKRNRLMVYINILSFIVLISILILNKMNVMYYIVHNCIAWILPFTLGVLLARNIIIIPKMSYAKYIVILFVGALLLMILNCNAYAWLFSPIVAIAIAVCLNNLLKPIKFLNSLFVYMGILSAFIFCVHPHLRQLYLTFHWNNGFIDIFFLYFIPTIIFAFIYKKLYQEMFAKDK
jgi:hypothetical protein